MNRHVTYVPATWLRELRVSKSPGGSDFSGRAWAAGSLRVCARDLQTRCPQKPSDPLCWGQAWSYMMATLLTDFGKLCCQPWYYSACTDPVGASRNLRKPHVF